MCALFFNPGMLFVFFVCLFVCFTFSSYTMCIGNMFPIDLFSRNYVHQLGSLVLLIEFSHMTWKFISPFLTI